LSRTFADHEITFLSSSSDGRRSLLFVQSDRSPGEFFLYDAQTKHVDMLRASRPDIDPSLMRPREHVTLTARDGVSLHGYLTRSASAGPQPMVVLPHDGPFETRSGSAFDSTAQLLANRGYAVLQINYRGSAGYGLKFEAAGYQKWGTAIQDDIADATRWAIERKVADPSRICILGTRFGGYSALMNAARESKLYRCAIGNAGIYDLAAWYEKGNIADSARIYLAKTMGSDAAVLREQSPVSQASRIEASVLLIQRRQDGVDRNEQTDAMYARLQKANKRVELFKPSGEQRAEMDRLVMERVLSFLDAQLN
jgi:dipeptidyl aminopeptidase/acylaminoacyl peptidase